MKNQQNEKKRKSNKLPFRITTIPPKMQSNGEIQSKDFNIINQFFGYLGSDQIRLEPPRRKWMGESDSHSDGERELLRIRQAGERERDRRGACLL